MLIKQLIKLEKVRTKNLKFRTDLLAEVMDGWSVTQQMILYKGRLLKSKFGACLANTWLSNTGFNLLQIWLQILVVIYSESHLTQFPSFCMLPSEVAVLFYLNLSRCPFLGQVADLDLLLCTGFNLEHAVLFLHYMFIQRPMTHQKTE